MSRSLHDIFTDRRPADKVIQYHLRAGKKLGSQDRRLFAEGVYDVVRWWRRLSYAADSEEYPALLEAWCLLHDVGMGKGIARSFCDAARVRARWSDPGLPRAIRESIPDWMDAWGAEQLPERWDELLRVLNQPAPVYLRANRLKITPEKLLARLEREKYPATRAGEDGLKLAKRANVFQSPSFHQGFFEVQDLHSQTVARELGVEPGMRVIDACAGAGGKSLHLAALMQGKGKIVALDVSGKKLEQLKLRSRRAGAGLIEARLIEGSKTIKRLDGAADRLLLDVPCSGMGILRRNPDAKWKLTPEDIERVGGLQREILAEYPRMCKPGGVIVYATCSIMPDENSRRVREFLSQNETRFSLEEERTLWPEVDGPDGFYFARFRRH